MKRRRVKITGIGPVTPAGIGREAFWKSLLEPISRIKPFTKLGPELGPFVAGSVDKFHIEEYAPSGAIPKGAARHTLFALAGATLALRDAGLSLTELNRMSAVVVAGSSLMDFEGIGRTIEGVISKGIRGAVTRTVFTTNAAVIPATIIDVLGLKARSIAIQTSCCAGMDAIGQAARMVATGEADVAICGGAEAPLYRTPLVELRAAGLTPATTENPQKLNRPFDLWRTTGVVSEGACMIILEPETSPRKGYSFISGYSFANDSADSICSGMLLAMKYALADACVKPHDIDAINAWGPGHSKIDAAEASALSELLGDQLQEIPAVSIKGAIGSPLGAAPAIQIAASALAHREGVLPPTVNWEYADPSCPLNLSMQARVLPHRVTLVNAHGLSGVNSSVVVERC
jgi:3-oxoacyl-(acyl-carrier-protein) synthase